MSKSFIKLIDASLVPAAVMICGKVAGLWLSNNLFKLNWGIETNPNDFFSVRIIYDSINDKIIASSYSNLIMFISVFIGFLIVLTRALFFHSSHISPRIIAKLATNNLLSLITDSFEIYYKASVWLFMLWLAFIVIFINALLGDVFIWTLAISFITSVLATTILLRDVAKEISLAKQNISKFQS